MGARCASTLLCWTRSCSRWLRASWARTGRRSRTWRVAALRTGTTAQSAWSSGALPTPTPTDCALRASPLGPGRRGLDFHGVIRLISSPHTPPPSFVVSSIFLVSGLEFKVIIFVRRSTFAMHLPSGSIYAYTPCHSSAIAHLYLTSASTYEAFLSDTIMP